MNHALTGAFVLLGQLISTPLLITQRMVQLDVVLLRPRKNSCHPILTRALILVDNACVISMLSLLEIWACDTKAQLLEKTTQTKFLLILLFVSFYVIQ